MFKKTKWKIGFIGLMVFVITCQSPSLVDNTPYPLEIPSHFPSPEIPKNNTLTNARVVLGKKLFYDPIISMDKTVSCNSCHLQQFAFADNIPISPGVQARMGFRNAPTLANAAYLDVVNKDGGVKNLDLQALTPIEDHDEMSLSILEAASRLREIPEYNELSTEAYGKKIDAFVISRALSSFMRTMISGNSPYDQYVLGDSLALSDSAKKGKDLFFSDRLNCKNCHSGFNFTDGSFRNNGIYDHYEDNGRERVSLKKEDNGKFRVPTLRNVELTAPYMHDGSIKSLEKVIEHYISGGKSPENKDDLIKPFDLTETEKKALVDFLLSLTDYTFIDNTDLME